MYLGGDRHQKVRLQEWEAWISDTEMHDWFLGQVPPTPPTTQHPGLCSFSECRPEASWTLGNPLFQVLAAGPPQAGLSLGTAGPEGRADGL